MSGSQNAAFQSIEGQITQIGADITKYKLDPQSVALDIFPASQLQQYNQSDVTNVINETVAADNASIAYLQSFQGQADPTLLSSVESYYQMDIAALNADLPSLSNLSTGQQGGLQPVQAVVMDQVANDLSIAYQDLQAMTQLSPDALGGTPTTPTPPPNPPKPPADPNATLSITTDPATFNDDEILYGPYVHDAQNNGGVTPTKFSFIVTRTGDTSQAATFNWSVTASGTNPAVAADFPNGAFPTGTITFPAGATSVTIDVAAGPHLDGTTLNAGFTVTVTGGKNIPSANGVIADAPKATVDQYADFADASYTPSITTVDGYTVAKNASGQPLNSLLNPLPVSDPFLPPNSADGYFGEAFQNGDNIVIAFRGTDKATWGNLYTNLLADGAWLTPNPNSLITAMIAQAALFVAQVQQQFPKANITFTGHSLGGMIAQVMGEATGDQAVTFNAPGAAQFYAALHDYLMPILNGSDVNPNSVNYRVAGDQVSLAGTPISKQVTLSNPIQGNLAFALYDHFMSTVYSVLHNSQVAQEPALPVVTVVLLGGQAISYAVGAAVQFGSFVVGAAQAVLQHFGLDTSSDPSAFPNPMPNSSPLAPVVSAQVATATTPSSFLAFEIDESASSPSFAAVGLPQLGGVANYDIAFKTASRFGPTQLVSAGEEITAPAGTTGFQFEALDANDQPVMLSNPGVLDASFASAGTVQASMTPLSGLSTPASGGYMVVDTTTNQVAMQPGTPYSGPVAGLTSQFADIAADSLNITAQTPNSFIESGSGNDAIDVSKVNGTNVLDGKTGSNFLVGGTGNDTFFVDDRSAGSDIWSTVVGFHAGDSATVFGVTQAGFSLNWLDGKGAVGDTGLTLSAMATDKPNATLTLAGYTSADLSNGRLTVDFGNELDGTPFLLIQGH